jgi:hypothetical protein
MAKFAPVAPIQVISKMPSIVAGDYHLLLAHDVANHDQEYRRYFGSFKNTVIMDNSVIELGNAVDLKVIKKALRAVDSATVVLPDVLLDGAATVASCKAALDVWADDLVDVGFGSASDYQRRGFMLVPQGKTLAEFAWCAQQFAHDRRINFWGVPRNLVKEIGSRAKAIDIVSAINHSRRIHLLGFSDDLPDDVICAKDRRVEGIDSAVPLRAGTLGILLDFDTVMPKRDPLWFDSAVHLSLMDENIERCKQWFRRN